ncbi:hypothetical protein [Nocardioides sp. YIM 152315]|uniref:phage tail tube protein n=1 Tax=Nocardioides sp. YIM 152315 TaxID=3031760 RepID=UPI0023DAA861|nr:hypothetical protein [Nocardioides sp. YIM 152315]MDF1603399.1 hypothetical protein [Nocardioides sp. YIM 152315]
MPLANPPTAKSLGQKSVVILTTAPAATTGIPVLTEVNAGVFGSLHFYGDFNVTPNQNTGEGPRKLGSIFSPTQLGQVTYPAVDAQYSYMPQLVATTGSDGNEVYEALVPGSTVTVVVLDGVDGDISAVVADDVADIYLMECGVRRKGQTGDGEFDEKSVTQSLIVKGGEPIAEDHEIAAA